MPTFILSPSVNIWWKHQVVLGIHPSPKFKDKYHHGAINMFKMLNAMTHYTFSIIFLIYVAQKSCDEDGLTLRYLLQSVTPAWTVNQKLQIRLVRKWNIAADRRWNMITIAGSQPRSNVNGTCAFGSIPYKIPIWMNDCVVLNEAFFYSPPAWVTLISSSESETLLITGTVKTDLLNPV